MNFKLKSTNERKEKKRRCPANLLALDFATSGIKAVRLRKVKDRIVLAAADILPPVGLDAEKRPVLPRPLAAYYTALCATMENTSLRVFSRVLSEEEDLQAIVRENLAVPDDYRARGRVLFRARGKRESTVLGVAVPEQSVQHYLSLFSSGAPAPYSLELSGLAAFSAFIYNCGDQTADQTVCVIETGARFTYAAFLHRNQLQIVNRFDIGSEALVRQMQQSLGVDADMAGTILAGRSVDVSAPLRQILGPLTKQLSIYREFVERQNKSVLTAVYISGGSAASPYWQTAIREVLGFVPEVWNPFEKLELPPEGLPARFIGQESRFAAAVGAALAGMEAV
jgi:Tfp pilus assembly PilM family ATPase